MQTKTFSLYKLPLVGSLVFILSMISIFTAIEIVNGQSFFSYNLLEGLLFIISSGIYISPIMGFMMMVYYYFDINLYTRKNIILTSSIVVSLLLVFSIGLGILALMGGYEGFMRYLVIILIAVLPLFFSLSFFYSIKKLQNNFDQYNGELLQGRKYWRFANLLSIYTFFSLILSSIMLVTVILGALIDASRFIISLVSIFMMTQAPVAISLLIIFPIKSPLLERLYTRQNLNITIVIFIAIIVEILLLVFLLFGIGSQFYTSSYTLIALCFLLSLPVIFFSIWVITNIGFKKIIQK